jgi:hypothetical protein
MTIQPENCHDVANRTAKTLSEQKLCSFNAATFLFQFHEQNLQQSEEVGLLPTSS